VIFEQDHHHTGAASVARAHFSVPASRVFGILNDPSSWGQARTPRVSSASAPSKIVLSFDGIERATVSIHSWSTDFCQLEVVLDGFDSDLAKKNLEEYWVQIWQMLQDRLGKPGRVVASSPAKVNVYFAVGSFLKNGFHEVASCYQALSLREYVSAELEGSFSISFAGTYAAESKALVPADTSNLVHKAGVELRKQSYGVLQDLVSFTINKSVPIAGGMAGGSADAAAALVALNAMFEAGLDQKKLASIAAKLGSDVPFCLAGGTAIGTGRGEKLAPVESQKVFHWVMTPNPVGLSTPDVYRKLDILRVEASVNVSNLETPAVPEELVAALVSGNVTEVAEYMHNDLEIATLALRPELAQTIEAGRKAGALRSMVSGSGPTIAHLAKDRVHAEQVANRLSVAGFPSVTTFTSLAGSRLES
jgi:4-diphosphocytidyl-2-C-methyl-D-erythritol kinase